MKAAVRKPSPTAIGAFVVGAGVLLVAGIAYFGQGQFFARTNTFVLFFDGSLQGLNVGAPVFLRGVKIGIVKEIVVRYHPAEQHIDIPVYVELDRDRVERVDEHTPPNVTMRAMIERGLRAQLVPQSFVTGVLAVQLDFFSNAPEKYHGADRRHAEIPTIPSTIEELTRTLQNLPVQELIDDLRRTVQGIDELIRSPELKAAVTSIEQTAHSFEKLVRDVNDQVGPVSRSLLATSDSARAALKTAEERIASIEQSLHETLESFRSLAHNADQRIGPITDELTETAQTAREALEQARETFAAVENNVAADSELYHNLVAALQDVSSTARSIRVLTDYLERHPEALLQGKALDGGR